MRFITKKVCRNLQKIFHKLFRLTGRKWQDYIGTEFWSKVKKIGRIIY